MRTSPSTTMESDLEATKIKVPDVYRKEGWGQTRKKRNIYQGLQRGANQTLRDGELKPFRNDLAPLGSGFTLYIVLIS